MARLPEPAPSGRREPVSRLMTRIGNAPSWRARQTASTPLRMENNAVSRVRWAIRSSAGTNSSRRENHGLPWTANEKIAGPMA